MIEELVRKLINHIKRITLMKKIQCLRDQV